MEYQKAVAYIHSLLKFGMKPGFERINAVLDQLGHPERQLRFVHVAGTNGKGSTCNMLSNILIDGGYKTGLFTSPYVVDFCERIQINSQMISHEALTQEVELVVPILEKLNQRGIEPTEFEVITALAFHFFAKEKCDIVVLEVGLGGRLDSTNVIFCPLASVITSVSFDHMAVLGNTLEEISSEKCGIIKDNGLTVSYPLQREETFKVIQQTCDENKNELLVPDLSALKIKEQSLEKTVFDYQGVPYQMQLIGEHQVYNAVTVIETALALQKRHGLVTNQNIINGIAQTVIPARMEVLQTTPLILLDGGHNEGCANALQKVLNDLGQGKRIAALMGMMADKEYETYLSITAPHFNQIICTAPHNPRALSAKALSEAASHYCADTAAYASVELAVEASLAALQNHDMLVVCGSFYLACEARPLLIGVPGSTPFAYKIKTK